MELNFVDDSDNVGDSTVQVDEISVHQGPVGVTSAILVSEEAPTINTRIPVPQCASVRHSVNVRAFAALGFQCQCATPCSYYKCSRAMLVLGTVLPPGTSTNHIAGASILQGAAMPPVAGVP